MLRNEEGRKAGRGSVGNQRGIDRRGFEWVYWQRKISAFRTLKGHTSGVASVAFSPDGTRLASAGYDDATTIKIWDARPLDAEPATLGSSPR